MKSNNEVIVEGIFIADTENSFVSNKISEVKLDFGGIKGDRHFGVTFAADSRQPMYPKGTEILNKRQISILAIEEIEYIAKELGIQAIQPEWLGANILVRGLPELTKLPIQARLMFPSGAGLINEGENNPCMQAGNEVKRQLQYSDEKLAQEFVKKAFGRRGIVCTVERPEMIRAQDVITLIYP